MSIKVNVLNLVGKMRIVEEYLNRPRVSISSSASDAPSPRSPLFSLACIASRLVSAHASSSLPASACVMISEGVPGTMIHVPCMRSMCAVLMRISLHVKGTVVGS